MYNLSKIDLGKDEAEQDMRLKEYFLKTSNYNSALSGAKTIVIGRKGSGKSAIFTLMKDELTEFGELVIPITPDQYSWSVLKDYEETGILPIQAHTNAWKITLLSSAIWKLNENNLIVKSAKSIKYYMKDSYTIESDNWFLNLVEKVKKILNGVTVTTSVGSVDLEKKVDFQSQNEIAIPIKATEEIKNFLLNEWPDLAKIRILIDRLDDSWDNSEKSQNLIIGLLKAANYINSIFREKIIVTVFLRSDIYDNLFFDDQDKLRQNEETLNWNNDQLKAIVCERVKVSLELPQVDVDNQEVWNNVFSEKNYRSRASAEKYIIDRTFKRPRDIISFVRFAIEIAIRNNHNTIEPEDTRLAEDEKYSQSKYKDLIIEYKKQFPYIKNLLDYFSGCLHKLSKEELISKLEEFRNTYEDKNSIKDQPIQILRQLFIWGVIGVKRQGRGRAGVYRGGTHFYYYYDDPSINPLKYEDYYIHPSLRSYLNVSEKREPKSA